MQLSRFNMKVEWVSNIKSDNLAELVFDDTAEEAIVFNNAIEIFRAISRASTRIEVNTLCNKKVNAQELLKSIYDLSLLIDKALIIAGKIEVAESEVIEFELCVYAIARHLLPIEVIPAVLTNKKGNMRPAFAIYDEIHKRIESAVLHETETKPGIDYEAACSFLYLLCSSKFFARAIVVNANLRAEEQTK